MGADKVDCLCAGIAVADLVCAPLTRLPVAGELVATERHTLTIGGCAANVAADLARLGVSVGIVARCGEDPLGAFLQTALVRAGVKTDRLQTTPGVSTSATQVVNIRGEDRRFIHSFGANAAFDGSELTGEQIAAARVLYVGGFCLMPALNGARLARLFQQARDAGVLTVLDVVIPDERDYWPELAQALPWTDVFLPNCDEAQRLTGLADPILQADRCYHAGATTVVITCGGDGAVLVNPRERLRSTVFPVSVVDGTGSGDAFAAGYILGLLRGAPPAHCLELGSALGASCVQAAGATTSVFTSEQLEAFLAEQRLEIAPLAW